MTTDRYIRVVNWVRFQHYKHRNPPWIKLYCEMLSSRTWVTLDDSSRVLAFAVLMLAARHENKIPMDPAYIRRVAYLNSDPSFAGLLETNFVEIVDDASNLLAPCTHDASNLHQNALPETETETEKRQSREEKKNPSSELKSSSDQASVLSQSKEKCHPKSTPTPKATPKPSHEAEKLAALLSGEIRRNSPNFRVTPGQLRKWAIIADLMLRRDRRSYDEIAGVIRWCQADEFWRTNVLSFNKLREKFDQLLMKAEPQHRRRPSEGISGDWPEADAAVCKTCSGLKQLHLQPHVPTPLPAPGKNPSRLIPCPDCSGEAANPQGEADNSTLRKPAQDVSQTDSYIDGRQSVT